MTDLAHELFKMPDGWGKVFKPAIHPSSASLPSCPRRFMYAVRLGWRFPEWSEALSIGKVFHSVMEQIYRGNSIEAAVQTTMEAASLLWNERSQRLLMEANVEDPPPSVLQAVKANDARMATERKAVAVGVALASAFQERHPISDAWQIIEVEKTLVDKDRGIEGTLDAVIHTTSNDGVWIVDHKTTGGDPADRAACASFDVQSELYRHLWSQEHDAPFGVIHNIVRKPAIRLKRNETVAEYVERVLADLDDKAMANPQRPPILQSYVAFTSPPLDQNGELISLLMPLAHEHTRRVSELSEWPRCGNAYAGCYSQTRLCPYMKLCQASPRRWYELLTNSGFEKKDPDDDRQTN